METSRPPIVTILGHVDHGKTTLLDFIRKSSVASKEHGGITQHIGAYQITHNSQLITFIDTPGHSAFFFFFSRGAHVADIAVLVIAADDGIMPQTTEAINHIQSAKVPLIIAVNKIDLPGINLKVQLEKIKKQLSDQKILVEEYGGDVPIIPLSAKTGEGIDKLLEMILLIAEMHELKGDPERPQGVEGVVIEANLDKFKGPIATVLIQNGTLKKGDQIILGGVKSKIRGMFDFVGKPLENAGPSTPVEILGLESVPEVGSVLGDESAQITSNKIQVTSLIEKLKQGESKTLKVIIKADKQGSLEAIVHSLEKHGESVEVVQKGTGDILEGDIKMASAVHAIIVGFNVKVLPQALKLSESEGVLIRTYNIIYELLDEIEDVIEGMVKPGRVEEVLGKGSVIAEFPFGKDERVAGCRVTEGLISKGTKIRVLRDGLDLGEARLKSLRVVKDEVNKVEKGKDCGMIFDPAIDFQIGDMVESFRII